MSVLNRDAILSCNDITTRNVHVPEWGGDVRIKMLTGAEREQLESRIQAFNNNRVGKKQAVRAIAVVMSAVSEDLQPLFTDADVEPLAQKSGAALDRIFEGVLSLNAMSKKDAADLEKN